MWRTLTYFDIGLGCIYPVVVSLQHTLPPDFSYAEAAFERVKDLLSGLTIVHPRFIHPTFPTFGGRIGTAWVQVLLNENRQLLVLIYGKTEKPIFKIDRVFAYRFNGDLDFCDWDTDFQNVLPMDWYFTLESYLIAQRLPANESYEQKLQRLGISEEGIQDLLVRQGHQENR